MIDLQSWRYFESWPSRLSFGLERFQPIVPFLQFQRFSVNLRTQTRWDHYSRMQGGGQGETNAASQTDGNQFRDDELIILEDLGDGKMVKNIFSKIGRRLRLAHEENAQLLF
jgi:hypothetical protein